MFNKSSLRLHKFLRQSSMAGYGKKLRAMSYNPSASMIHLIHSINGCCWPPTEWWTLSLLHKVFFFFVTMHTVESLDELSCFMFCLPWCCLLSVSFHQCFWTDLLIASLFVRDLTPCLLLKPSVMAALFSVCQYRLSSQCLSLLNSPQQYVCFYKWHIFTCLHVSTPGPTFLFILLKLAGHATSCS